MSGIKKYCEGLDCTWCDEKEPCIYKTANELQEQLTAKEQECEQLRETMHKDICTHYVLGECSQEHHNNCVGRKQCIKDLEQECERLKKIIDEAKNSKLDLKSFLVGEAVQNEYEQQLDQLKAENEALKNNDVFSIRLFKDKADKYKKALAEIKEIAETCSLTDGSELLLSRIEQIIEKISEVIDEN